MEEKMERNIKKLKKKDRGSQERTIEKFQGENRRRGGMQIHKKSLQWKFVKGWQYEMKSGLEQMGIWNMMRPDSSAM